MRDGDTTIVGLLPALPNQGLVVKQTVGDADDEYFFVLPIVGWIVYEGGFSEAIAATADVAETESEISRVSNWSVDGYHMPPFLPHGEVIKR